MLASRRFMGLSLGGARRVRRRAFWLVSSPRRAALQLRDSTGIKPDFPRSSRMRFESQYILRAPPRSRVPQPPRSSVLHSTMRVSLPLLIAQVAGVFCVFAVVLFGAAGTIAWPAGWAFLMLFFGFVIVLSAWLIRYNPSLLTERMTGIGKSDQKLWDKFFFAALNGLFIVWLVTMPLDAVRFHWSNMPIAPTGRRNRPDRLLLLLLPNLQRKRLSFTSSSHPIRPRPARRHNGSHAYVRHPKRAQSR